MDDPDALKPSRNVLMASQNEGFTSNVPISLMFTATESDSDMKDDEDGSEVEVWLLFILCFIVNF